MEDDKGLDLSLSLPYGGKSTIIKVKNGICSEAKAGVADRGSKLIDDFKNFLDGGTQNEDYVVGSQRNNRVKPEENLFYDLSNSTINGKRKNLFDEINHQKQYKREPHLVDLLDKRTRPHISITKDEGSMAENEDVADSKAEGSPLKLVQHHEGKKEVNGVSNSIGTHMQGVRMFPDVSKKEIKAGSVSPGVTFSGPSILNTLNMMAPTSNDRRGTLQPVIPATLPSTFGDFHMQTPPVEPVPVNASKAFEEGPSSHTTIKSGIAAELKFGGSGLSPDLPWVSTTGAGPNGKTISGVTYKHDSQVRVVCACHGSHMSYEEFVQHASEDRNNDGLGPASVPNNNPAASAQS